MNAKDIKPFLRYANWYNDIADYLQLTYGDDAELVADLLAATSPRVHVKKNWKLALRIYDDFKAGRDINLKGIMKTMYPNINRALKGEELSGEKVKNFAKNLKGNLDAITIDVWMLRAYGLNDKSISKKQYTILAKRIRRESKRLRLYPAEFQAVVWTKVRYEYGFKHRSFLGARDNQLQFGFMKG